jgi:hypothetical protein
MAEDDDFNEAMNNDEDIIKTSENSLGTSDAMASAVQEIGQKSIEDITNTLKEERTKQDGLNETFKEQYGAKAEMKVPFDEAKQEIIDTDGNPKTADAKRMQNYNENINKMAKTEASKGWDWVKEKFSGPMGKLILLLFFLGSIGTGLLIQKYDPYQLNKCFMIKSCVPNSQSTGQFVDLPCGLDTCGCNRIQECQASLPECGNQDAGCPFYYYISYTLDDILTQVPAIPKAIWEANNDPGTSTMELLVRSSIFMVIAISSIVGGVVFYKWYVRTFNPPI